jgi:SH3-like domain-containing protein
MKRRVALGVAWAFAASCCAAAEFKSIAEGTVLYDAPSVKAHKLAILQRDYPVEMVVALQDWAKVRDATGAFSWLERKHLSDRRTLLVKAELAQVRGAPSDSSPVVFQAARDVVLTFLETATVDGWLKVAHADGHTGYVRTAQVWGG